MIEALASEPQYRAHLEPVWHALPAELRGAFHVKRPHTSSGLYLAASYRDLFTLGRRRAVLLEHGAGQSYSSRHPAYAGGRGRESVVLFVCPNEQSAARNRAAYPSARVAVVGDPRVEDLRAVRYEPDGSIAVTWHWNCSVAPEARWAWPHYKAALAELASVWKIVGHAHPRVYDWLAPWYESVGIEPVKSFREIVKRASLLMADNTSSLFEFAACGRPVVVLNAPWYRQSVSHGLRFWDCAGIGVNVWEPSELAGAIEEALLDPTGVSERRAEIVDQIYPVGESIARTVTAIVELEGCLVN